ncbi:MAG: SprT-like domain-containing protein [Thermoanaerobaculia bacterium]
MSALFPAEPMDEESRLQRLYDRLAWRFGLGAAQVRLSRRKLTGGEIRYGKPHVITISAHLSEAERRETLLHEAAHAWAFAMRRVRAGHGALFQRLARRLGVKGRHAPLTPALSAFRARKQILYRCEGCRRIFRRFRAFRRGRYCVACDQAGRPCRLRRVTE